jgi:hypothetical protein
MWSYVGNLIHTTTPSTLALVAGGFGVEAWAVKIREACHIPKPFKPF